MVICPVITSGGVGREGVGFTPFACMSIECAWWNETYGKCSIAVPAYKMGYDEERAERQAEHKYNREHS